MRKLFGTDGIRGRVGDDLTLELVTDIGRAVATASREGILGPRVEHPRFVIGRDTRSSGPQVEDAFIEGAMRAGADVARTAILPTGGIAYLTGLLGFDAGVVVSASHNPPSDNGIKVFGPGGWKLEPGAEDAIESLVRQPAAPSSGPIGERFEVADAEDSYITHLTTAAEHDVAGLEIVVDCANGAASPIAPVVFDRLGITAMVMNAETDGSNINDGCGALHPEVVQREAKSRGVIGITFDGDADRVILSDEDGRLVGGDAILALLGSSMRSEGLLMHDTIVATVMANEALRRWCASEQLSLIETPVGDRYVLEAMRKKGAVLGGEQSGHIICLDRSTTGDGILVALRILDVVATSGKRLADLVPFQPFPQVLVNVRTEERRDVAHHDGVRAAVERAEAELGSCGRVLIRASGTEPLVRVMVEAEDETLAHDVADHLATAVRVALEGA
ncbi:MAG: phosphoglucosamine mutase [Actinomycetota bacterium]